MSAKLTIRTLGAVTLALDDQPLAGLGSRTAEALLIYLACHTRVFDRGLLAELLWDNRPPKQAAANLRSILSTMRRRLKDHLVVDRNRVAFNHAADYWLDAAQFEELVSQAANPPPPGKESSGESMAPLAAAIDLYQGNFLEGFYVRQGRGFEEWAVLERERLRRLASTALRRLVEHFLQSGDYATGIGYAERLLAIDPYDEAAQRHMMWLLARSGRRNAALRRYEQYCQLLVSELGVEPAAATTATYERIQKLSFPPRHNLPPEPTPFVGRTHELEEILRRLSQPGCRLLSLLGPGGMGKTRLATEVARRIVASRPGQFLDGVAFVPLAALGSDDYLAPAVADALDFDLQGGGYSREQLLAHLQDQELLLVLDNFEHLISDDSLKWLSQLLTFAPSVKILLTTRERLRLVEEQVFDLAGLGYPETVVPGTATAYGAVQLFLQQANRVNPSFQPAGDDLLAIIELCRLVEGMPLGIELAAAGVRYLSCGTILEQLRQRLDATYGQLRNRPQRHQSLQAVFEHAWSQLSPEEQRVMRRFAVFQGSFDAAAAEAVTGARLDQLAAFCDKSFLQRRHSERFDMHPLLRRFLSEKLAQNRAEQNGAGNRHAGYYHRLVLVGGVGTNMERHYHELAARLRADGDNVIAAALWAASQRDFANRRFVTLIEVLIFYFNRSHRFEGWKAVFHQLIKALLAHPDHSQEERWLVAILRSRIAYADLRLHAYDRARQALETHLAEAYDIGNGALISHCLECLGILARRRGDYAGAQEHLEAAIEAVSSYGYHYQWPARRTLGNTALAAGLLERAQQAHEQAFAHAVEYESRDEAASIYELALGRIAHRRGRLAEARQHLEQALDLARVKGDRAELLACLRHLGLLLIDVGDFETAGQIVAEAAQLAVRLRDRRHDALLACARGWLAEAQDDLDSARQHYHRAVSLLEQIGDHGELPFAQAHLARVLLALGELDEAGQTLSEAQSAFRAQSHQSGLAMVNIGSGLLYWKREAQKEAEHYLKSAARGAWQAGDILLTVRSIAAWALRNPSPEAAAALLCFVLLHPAATGRDRARASVRLEVLSEGLSPAEVAAAQAWAGEMTLDQVVAGLAGPNSNRPAS